MTYNADRMRDLIRDTASQADKSVIDAVLGMADALDHYTDAVNRLAHTFDRTVSELRDDLHAVVTRVESIADAYARRSELDDLRAELRELTATPFDSFDPRSDHDAAA